ncbi:MAG TPA: hypothetical protein DDY16_05215 [Tenacibaculum sp.]|nr:hypothetical protein [Tenacibaculum sp.]
MLVKPFFMTVFLDSVVSQSESFESVKPLVKGIIKRYADAGVDPPKVSTLIIETCRIFRCMNIQSGMALDDVAILG